MYLYTIWWHTYIKAGKTLFIEKNTICNSMYSKRKITLHERLIFIWIIICRLWRVLVLCLPVASTRNVVTINTPRIRQHSVFCLVGNESVYIYKIYGCLIWDTSKVRSHYLRKFKDKFHNTSWKIVVVRLSMKMCLKDSAE